MSKVSAQIGHYLAQYRQGQADDAFHGLLELGHDGLPELEAEFRAATNPEFRAFLIHVIWQHRQQSVIPLLSEALLDPQRRVWREALDGLVTLGSPASVDALLAARGRNAKDDFSRWLEEGIEQAAANTQIR